ncbi:MAG: thioredoxin [Clostridiales bacterium]|nr:thioredoxin [Clostridiales bacterium]
MFIWQILLLTAGGLAILAGIYREEVRTVLMKAIYICLECIGIG